MYSCLDDRLMFDISVIEILIPVGKREVRHHALYYLKWAATRSARIPTRYRLASVIHAFMSIVLNVHPVDNCTPGCTAKNVFAVRSTKGLIKLNATDT